MKIIENRQASREASNKSAELLVKELDRYPTVSDNRVVSTKGPVLYTFVESLVFTKQLQELALIETLYAIQSDLLADPERWPVIPGTKGARKGRITDPISSHGKRGSFRYIYLYLKHRERIYLLTDVWKI